MLLYVMLNEGALVNLQSEDLKKEEIEYLDQSRKEKSNYYKSKIIVVDVAFERVST